MRPFFLTLFTLMTGLLAHGQAHSQTYATAVTHLSQLYGGMPLDSPDAVIVTWCQTNGFAEETDTTSPYLWKFRRTTPGDTRFANIPDSILTFIYFSRTGKTGTIANYLPPALMFSLIYLHDRSKPAEKEFENLKKMFQEWTGNLKSVIMQDAKGDYKKWEGMMSHVDPPENFPMLNLTYSVSNKQPERAEVMVLYLRKPIQRSPLH